MGFAKRKNNSGFTLIELLITIAVISILAAVVISNLGNQQKKARDAKRKADLNNIQTALVMYSQDNGDYPLSCGGDWCFSNSASSPWIPGLTSQYIKELPVDPINKKGGASYGCQPRDSTDCFEYGYYHDRWCNLNQTPQYILVARLETNPSDTSQSQRPYYYPDGSFCSNWSESPVGGIYVTGE